VLFFNIQPLFIVKPFQDLKNLTLQSITLPLRLSLSFKSQGIYSTFKKILDKEVFDSIMKLPAWMLGRIIERYKEGVDLWTVYVMDNLEEYCKKFESKLYWNTVKVTGIKEVFKDELSVERMLWIYFNQNIDKEEQVDFVMKLRESLLPWINNELWQQVEKKKENVRENVKYEEIREKIMFNSTINEEELDIIG
jgi:hypothetical protein